MDRRSWGDKGTPSFQGVIACLTNSGVQRTVAVPRTIAPRKLLVRRKTKLCRPKLQCSLGKRFSTDGYKWVSE